jgi:hypothetical protein
MTGDIFYSTEIFMERIDGFSLRPVGAGVAQSVLLDNRGSIPGRDKIFFS